MDELASVRYVVGRLRVSAPNEKRRGHAVRARAGRIILDSSYTDGAGRFLLRLGTATSDNVTVELVDPFGVAVESTVLTPSELVSPAVIVFSGKKLVSLALPSDSSHRSDVCFEADGDSPRCVTSSCVPTVLSWRAPKGSVVSILSDSGPVIQAAGWDGVVTVTDGPSRVYRLVVRGVSGDFERIVEVTRYPSLSVVVQGRKFERGSTIELGVSASCPARRGGMRVTILSSNPTVLPSANLLIPEGLTWTSAEFGTFNKAGSTTVTALAEGYVQDSVDIDLD